jgi:hypothetical protein
MRTRLAASKTTNWFWIRRVKQTHAVLAGGRRNLRSRLSRGSQIADCRSIFFNYFPRFNGILMAVKSRIGVLESRTN